MKNAYKGSVPLLRVAVPSKGRLFDPTVTLIQRVFGLSSPPGRSLTLASEDRTIEFVFVRTQDIPSLVDNCAADAGICGFDNLKESKSKSSLLLRLDYGRCKLVLAAGKDVNIAALRRNGTTRIATTFPNLTRSFMRRKGIRAAVVEISGSVEAAPSIGVADAVVDLTETGTTLKQNGLRILEVILESGAVLIARKSIAKSEAVTNLAQLIDSFIQARHKRYIMANVDFPNLERVASLMPGLKAPTILPLTVRNTYAIHAVVDESEVNRLIPKLKRYGATGILVTPIERLIQ